MFFLLFFFSDKTHIVSFGNGCKGRLGHNGPFLKIMRGGGSIIEGTSSNNQIQYTEIPREIMYYGQSLFIIDLACGKDHTIALDRVERRRRRSDGRSERSGRRERSGKEEEEEEEEGVVIETRVLTWGSGIHGQLGHGNNFLSFLPSPKIVETLVSCFPKNDCFGCLYHEIYIYIHVNILHIFTVFIEILFFFF